MSLQAYTQQPCVPCPKCKQDLESVLILQIGIIEEYLVRTSPKSGPQSGGPLEILIPANSDDYLDLSHCYLYLKCPVLKAEGSYIETLKAGASQGANSSIGPVNLLLHSLFGQVDLVMNNALVATYHYRAYLTNLLSYGRNGHNAKETWLRRLVGWHTDEAGKYYAQCNFWENKLLLSLSGKLWPDDSPGTACQQPAFLLQGLAALGPAVARATGAEQHECPVGAAA